MNEILITITLNTYIALMYIETKRLIYSLYSTLIITVDRNKYRFAEENNELHPKITLERDRKYQK